MLRPDRMKVVPGPDGWPEAYDYTVGGQTVRFEQDAGAGVRPILHMALFHPLNDHYGMSPLEPAATGIDLHNASGAWNKALLDNSACPSGALVYTAKDGQLTPEQFDRLKAELEESFQGAKNAGRPLLLEGGLDWKAMAFSPKDMDFIAAKHVAAREVALALGVPPMLLGIPGDNTYSNYAEANRSFWRQTVLPLVNRTAKALVGMARACFAGKDRGAPCRRQRSSFVPISMRSRHCRPSARRCGSGCGGATSSPSTRSAPRSATARSRAATGSTGSAAAMVALREAEHHAATLRRRLLPEREVKFAPCDLKSVEADGTFTGYASLFGEVDLGQDLVMPGAFRDSLRRAARAASSSCSSTIPTSRSGCGSSSPRITVACSRAEG